MCKKSECYKLYYTITLNKSTVGYIGSTMSVCASFHPSLPICACSGAILSSRHLLNHMSNIHETRQQAYIYKYMCPYRCLIFDIWPFGDIKEQFCSTNCPDRIMSMTSTKPRCALFAILHFISALVTLNHA